ncbi:SGNH/GDSL hydrolase family protein [Bremerella sp. T1]|uniref:SGNH/GDSL hydrolase family protein n=1 Tax=Bremerella sp. TYQ1 TaxID=3119568 RepID=UPI001CCAA8C0|nr:SGNH/GDSL hydrolase family protein [Bremerella volcania]UBM37445.1 GDSL-type esterase/lipase family protein [Bremerella volcania]
MKHSVLSLLLIVAFASMSFAAENEVPKSIARWQKDMDKFAAADEKKPVKPGGVVFVGSSSIRMWDLPKFYPDMNAVNRGFGGSRLEDSVYYADKIILPYKPKTVVVYAGDNDIAADYTPEQILEDFQEFVKTIRAELPKTKILYIAVKPSIKRWSMIKEVRETNKLIAAECEKTKNCEFIDIDTPMLGEDGKPRPELFLKDGLHMTDEGYAVWVEALQPHLQD